MGGAGGGGGSRGGAGAADLGEEEVDDALVAGEENVHALALVALASARPLHLALLAVHDLVAIIPGMARPRVEHLLAHCVAARQRLRAPAESLGVDIAWRGEEVVMCASGMGLDAVGLRLVAPIGIELLPHAVASLHSRPLSAQRRSTVGRGACVWGGGLGARLGLQ